MTRILITGGCGFIGHHLVAHLLQNTDWQIYILDKLTYASNGLNRLRDIDAFDGPRVTVLTVDFAQPISIGVQQELGAIDYIVHMGADTHVDRSILDPTPFVLSNVVGTMHILNYARKVLGVKRFIYFSTDEVFGPAPTGIFYKEWDRYNSSNPYAATKAGAEELCLAYAKTYSVPLVIMHTMNTFGERQHPEKFIPLVVSNVIRGETVNIHSDLSTGIIGSRFYIHARNVADAVVFLLERGSFREKYNIVGEREVDNLSLANMIADIIGKPLKYELVDFHSSRPGHDLRYALDGSKMAALGWVPGKTGQTKSFDDSLLTCVNWMLERQEWLEVTDTWQED